MVTLTPLRSARRMAGFTTLEILVVVTVLIILASLAGSALSGMVVTQQLRNATYDVAASLTFARSEALARNVAVSIDPVDGDWARGWTVTEAGGVVLRRQAGYPRVAVSGPVRLAYSSEGRPDSVASPFAVTALQIPVDQHRCVAIRVNGRYGITKGSC